MGLLRRGRFLVVLVALLSLSLYLLHLQRQIRSQLPEDFSSFDNVKGVSRLVVPNLIHFIHFDRKTLDFVALVCILSAYYNHGPSKVYIHTNVQLKSSNSYYYRLLEGVMGKRLKRRIIKKPTHVFGQKLTSVEHASDVARIKVLMQFGGIYLDQDVFVVKSLSRFRHFEMVVGWPKGQSMGSQVLVAHKDARFLKLWMESYREYRGSSWYYNAGEAPTRNILEKKPELVHRVEEDFGVQNLADKLYKSIWPGWTNMYTIHLLANHKYLTNTSTYDENNIEQCHCTYSVMANQILDLIAADYMDIREQETGAGGEEEGAVEKRVVAKPSKSSTKKLAVKSSTKSHLVKAPRDLKAEDRSVADFLGQSSPSLLRKHLSMELYSELKNATTSTYGSSLYDVIKSGLKHPDSAVGLYAPDTESYRTFRKLFLPVVREFHSLPADFSAQPAPQWGHLAADFNTTAVISTRIRIARSLSGFPLNSKMSSQTLKLLEKNVTSALSLLSGDLEGNYLPLGEISPEDRQALLEEHLLFDKCDRYLLDGGACQYWPEGRGIYISKDRKLVVWVNEEDHMRIISIEKGGNLSSVYTRLKNTVELLEKRLSFVWDSEFGYLTYCPSNLGTTLRASVHIKLPKLSESKELLESEASKLGLQVRGTQGEHTAVKEGILDISNRRRLGISEHSAVSEMFDGIQKLISIENTL